MNYRATNGPVAAEAFPFALPLAAVAFLTLTLDLGPFMTFIGAVCVILLVFVLAFFRNPERYHKRVANSVISGADGQVVAAGLTPHEDFPGGQCLRIAIFMNVFNCHVNWSPVAGRVIKAVHYPGKFLNAMSDKCAEENERKILQIVTPSDHLVEVKLVAGLVARRIVCPVEKGDELQQGEKVGLIRFGSRVEILLPSDSALHVRPGMIIRGGETIVATLPEGRTIEGDLA